jgi:hypothetical protein
MRMYKPCNWLVRIDLPGSAYGVDMAVATRNEAGTDL